MKVTKLQMVTVTPPIPASHETSAGAERQDQLLPKASSPSKAEPPEAVTTSAEKKGDLQEKKRVEEAVKLLNDYMKRSSFQLRFSVDSDTKEIVVKVVQKDTGKVIRQIPSEEALKIAKSFDPDQGLLIKQHI